MTECPLFSDKKATIMNTSLLSTYSRKFSISVIVLAVALLVWQTLFMLLLIFLGVIFAIFLRKTGELVASRIGLRIQWAMTIVMLILVLLLAAAVWLMAPKLAAQSKELIRQLPDAQESFQQTVFRSDWGERIIRNLPSPEKIAGSLGGLMKQATSWLYSFFGALTGILIIVILGLYLAFDAETYINGIVKLAPKEKRERTRRILEALGATLYWWLIGRIVSMTIIGLFTFLGLLLLGVPLAFTLGLFAAAMTFIPNIGPIISVIPAVLLSLQTGWAQAGYVLILYTALQTVESYLITPLVQRRAIDMPPALIISAQILMGVIQGLLGILVATPLTAVIIILVKFLYIQGILGDEEIEIAAENR